MADLAGRAVLVLFLCVCAASTPAWATTTTEEDQDYGGVPLWINRILGEPSVLTLQGRAIDTAWYRANNPYACPLQCDCPIQWPTAVYCDHRALGEIPDDLPDRTQYLFLQVGKQPAR